MRCAAHGGHGLAHHVRAIAFAHCLHAAVQHHRKPENDLICSARSVEVAVAAHGSAVSRVDQRHVSFQPQRVAQVDFCQRQRLVQQDTKLIVFKGSHYLTAARGICALRR
jgi:hypothetical protein